MLFGQEPHWVKNRPVSDKYIIGIGYADKKTKDYRAVAKANAQGEIASTISVNISSELIDIMTGVDGDIYISGDGAEDYLETELFIKKGIEVELQKFTHPQYKQNFPGFEPNMSALDALFNIGPNLNYEGV